MESSTVGSSGGVLGFLMGPGLVSQLILVVILVFLGYAIMTGGKSFLDAFMTYGESNTMLLPYLYDSPQVIYQDPNQSGSITVYPSANAPGGLEFSYSCYLLLKGTNFHGGGEGLRHIFHKGSPVYKPLMCPGVFVKNNENTLVVHMNEAASWNTKCEITNIPVGKWFHFAIVVRNMNVDIYINGNVAYRMTLSSVPKQNFGDIYVFKNETFNGGGVGEDAFKVVGRADGMISVLEYNAYALNYEQIDRQVRAGPSTKLVSATQDLPPYLSDAWWVTYYK